MDEEHAQWLLSSMEREEYEAWLASLEQEKRANLDVHFNQLARQTMNIDEIYPSTKSLKAEDLKGHTVEVTIASTEVKKFENGSKIVIRFEGKEKTLVVNKTNAKIIASAYGSNTDGWVGKKIQIYPDKTMFGTDLVDCIRVRIPAPPVTSGATNF